MSSSRGLGLDIPYLTGELWISLVETIRRHVTFSGFEYCQTSDPQKYHQMTHFQIDLNVANTNIYSVRLKLVQIVIKYLLMEQSLRD